MNMCDQKRLSNRKHPLELQCHEEWLSAVLLQASSILSWSLLLIVL